MYRIPSTDNSGRFDGLKNIWARSKSCTVPYFCREKRNLRIERDEDDTGPSFANYTELVYEERLFEENDGLLNLTVSFFILPYYFFEELFRSSRSYKRVSASG